jgi:hypothetical protein
VSTSCAIYDVRPDVQIPEAMKPRAIPITRSSKLLEVQPTKVAA